MTIDWIIGRLKVSGQGTKQEVLNALENASFEDLKELAVSAFGASLAMKMCGIKKYSDRPQSAQADAEV